jgi:hypothetical protein
MTTAVGMQADENIDLLFSEKTQPPSPKLWPIATESQTLASTLGWEKIPKGTTHDFPAQTATVRVARDNGKPEVTYGIYFVFDKRTNSARWTNWMTRLIVTVHGEINGRAFSMNGTIPADKETFQTVMDTTFHIESEFQRIAGYRKRISV